MILHSCCPFLKTILLIKLSKSEFFREPDVDNNSIRNSVVDTLWETFSLVDSDQLKLHIKACRSKTCSIDPVPTSLVKSSMDQLLPIILRIVNSSLQEGVFPDSFKMAHITPILKKSDLDPECLNNYRPVSNLAFVSKVIEKVVVERLQIFLMENNLFEPMQSAYRSFHSTETAMLRVHDDIICALGSHQVVLMVLLDLSAAFDTVNHKILLNILHKIGIGGTVLQWFSSYLTSRKQLVKCGVLSETHDLTCGVPQGSILGPILFTLYTSSLGNLISSFVNIRYHFYADDTQLYIAFDPNHCDRAVREMENCVSAVRQWMDSNHLKMNDGKTEVVCIGTDRNLSKLKLESVAIAGSVVTPVSNVKVLGVTIDSGLTLSTHINKTCKAAFFHLRNIARIKRYLPRDCLEQIVHSLIFSKLDYCNSLYLGLPLSQTSKLQRVQNAAARLITGGKKFDHMSPILMSLHWLPVEKRVIFKILLLVYKVIHGIAPSYISDLLTPRVNVRSLRSTTAVFPLSIPFTNSNLVYNRSFQYAAPRLWNNLPDSVKVSGCVTSFKANLKTHLFRDSCDF